MCSQIFSASRLAEAAAAPAAAEVAAEEQVVAAEVEGSTAVQGGRSCLFVSHRSVESSEIENYYSP